MTWRGVASPLTAAWLLAEISACSVPTRPQAVGAYVDDAAITSTVKSRMVEDRAVDIDAIAVETQNGNVMLSGYARNSIEKSTAESIAMKVRGVKSVQNNVVVRP